MSSPRDSYLKLRKFIADRQEFESLDQQVHPYTTYRTTLDFYNIDGIAALHAACLLDDTDAINELLNAGADIELRTAKKGASSLEISLQAGRLAAAKLLYERGARCNKISMADIHPTCRGWFKEKVQLATYASATCQFFHHSDQQFFFGNDTIPRHHRMIELGDMEGVKSIRAQLGKDASALIHSLQVAVSNGHLEVLQYILTQYRIKLTEPVYASLLFIAVDYGHLDILRFMLSQGIDVNVVNRKLETPVMLAALNPNTECLALLLKEKPDLLREDVDGHTVVSYAKCSGNPESIKLIMMQCDRENVARHENIYGRTDRNDLSNRIDQHHILRVMQYFLKLNYRSVEYFINGGHCNGFSFLSNYYMSIGKVQYYFDTLTLIGNWDGSSEKLREAFAPDSPQGQTYRNLYELIDQWIQDIIWFQANKEVAAATIQCKQKDRAEQFNFVSTSEECGITMVMPRYPVENLNELRLVELIKLIGAMPAGICFQLYGNQHSTGGMVVTSRNEIMYHDSNFIRPIARYMNAESLGRLMMNQHFRDEGEDYIRYPAGVVMYHFNQGQSQPDLKNFELFFDEEYPGSVDEAKRYQAQSPNRFTHLHAAVFAGSIISLKKLLLSGMCEINAVNVEKETAFDMAARIGNKEMVILLMNDQGEKIEMNIEMAANMLVDYDSFAGFLSTATPGTAIACGCAALRARNFEFARKFVLFHARIINHPSSQGDLLLYVALQMRSPRIIPMLLQAGASVLACSKSNTYLKKETTLEFAIRVESIYTTMILDCITPGTLDEAGFSIPHYAAKYKSIEVLNYAVKHGHDLRLLSRSGKSVLNTALEHNDSTHKYTRMKSLEIILQALGEIKLLPFLDLNSKTEELCHLVDNISWDANHATHHTILLYLLRRAINKDDLVLFTKVTMICPLEILNQPSPQKPIISYAAGRNRVAMVSLLVERGVSIDADLLAANLSAEIKELLTPKSIHFGM